MSETVMSFRLNDGSLPYQSPQSTSPRERLAAAFKRAVAHSSSPAKELARAIGLTPRGAEELLRGKSAPSAQTLMLACQRYDCVWEVWREQCGRANTESEAEQLLAEITARLQERRT